MKKGFTLIELLIYGTIVTLLLGGFLVISVNLLQGRIKNTSIETVSHNARFAMEKMVNSIRDAEQINSPLAGNSSSSLDLGGTDFSLYNGILEKSSESDALDFDGVDDYVEMPNQYDFGTSNDFSISGWVYINNYSDFGAILQQSSGANGFWAGYNLNDGKMRMRVGGTVNDFTDVAIDTGEWKFLSFVVDRNTHTIQGYLDGSPVQSKSISASDSAFIDEPVRIGEINNYFFDGKIDDVRIYNRALTEGEIQDLYNEKDVDSTGLKGHWKFDEGEGTTANDSSGNDNHGSIEGASWIKYDDIKASLDALDFDGSNDYVGLTSNVELNSDFTISGWAYHKSNGGFVTGGGYDRILLRDTKIYIEISNNSYWYPSVPSMTGDWVYVTLSRINSTGMVYLYLDGELIGSNSGHSGDTSWNRIGNQGSYWFGGSIDDVRIYNRALSSTEISNLYQRYPISDEGLVGHWKFDEGEGTTANDSSGNNNHGTIEGASWVTYEVTLPLFITSTSVFITNLTFSNVSYADTPGTIRIEMTMEYNNPYNNPKYDFSRTFYVTENIKR